MNATALKAATVVAISASALTYSPSNSRLAEPYPTPDFTPGPRSSGAFSSGSKIAVFVRSATNKAADTRGTQGYYWTQAWQREEAIALRELKNGDYQDFASAEDLIAWLNAADE